MSLSSSPVSEGPGGTTHQFWSVDSAPARLTQSLSIWVAPAVLVLFTAVATLLLLAVNRVPALMAAFPNHDIIFSPYAGTHSVPLRIFILSFYIAFAAVVGASGPARLRFLGELIASFVLVCGLFDLGNILAFRLLGLVYSLHVVEIISGLLGYFIFSLKLLENGSMPARVAVPPRQLKRRAAWPQLVLAMAGALALSVLVDGLNLPLIGDLRSLALLGGIGPGVFLFLPSFALIMLIIIVLLVNNTIKLAIYSQRFLIRSMQLVGATNGFIQRPYVMRGAIQGLIGGVLAGALLIGLQQLAVRNVEGLAMLQEYDKIVILVASVLSLGVLIGISSTYQSLARYLRMALDDLY